eukprot:CAMPEP_0114512418 /NCGR_PEP_ID=MMETSP0109-20121206/14965_1 /TAXON_ID=29199 /ORGANISM="Chlorarachnion reptans, Strain CCCM449" /LENGTH=67 /DNA_ID=CAMNT_0001692101 /DNA_START=16 /DNA_END=215 /DNA_ORIENTATION=+
MPKPYVAPGYSQASESSSAPKTSSKPVSDDGVPAALRAATSQAQKKEGFTMPKPYVASGYSKGPESS